jgi:hypothetical protein
MADAPPTNRLARELQNRETSERKRSWQPPQSLPTPVPQPGWVFRWIRISVMGQNDPSNTASKFREGWEPVRAIDHPELVSLGDTNSRYKDNIENGGLLLCKAPEEMVQQREEYYRNQANAQIEAVDNNFMRTEDKRMPLFSERKSTTSFGRGSR